MQWINKIQRAQRTDILLSNEAKRIINKYLDASQSLQLKLMANQAFQAFASGRLSLQQAKTEVTKQLLNMAETEGQKISNRIASETADQLIGALQWQYSSDEMYSEEDIAEGCYSFNKHCRKANLLHLIDTNGFQFIESYILLSEATIGETKVKKGSWVATIEVEDQEQHVS